MDTRPADDLRHRIARFSQAIEETREHFSELSAFGRYPPSAPYYERSGILQLFNSSDIGCEVQKKLLQEFHSIERDLVRLERERKGVYRYRLREELHACLDTYSAAVCHANLGCMTPESGSPDLFCRDRIAVLVHELEKDHNLTEVKNLLCTLDANLNTTDPGTSGETADPRIPAAGTLPAHDPGDGIEG